MGSSGHIGRLRRLKAMRSLLLIATLLSATSLAAEPLLLDEGFDKTSLETHLRIHFETRNEALSWEQASRLSENNWHPLISQRIRFTDGQTAAWLRFDFETGKKPPPAVAVAARDTWMNHVDFYHLHWREGTGSLGGQQSAGDAVNQRSNAYFSPHPSTDLPLAPNERNTLLIRLENPLSVSAAFDLASPAVVQREVFAYWSFFGLQAGVLTMLIIVQWSLYRAFREATIAAYISYLLSYTVYLCLRDGVIAQLFPALSDLLANSLYRISVCVTYFFALQFSRRFLDMRRRDPRANRVVAIIQYVCLAPGFFALLDVRLGIVLINWMAAILGPLLLLYVLFRSRRDREARFYAVAWSLPIVAAILDNLIWNPWFPTLPVRSDVILKSAVLIEFAIFAFLLRGRIERLTLDQARATTQFKEINRELSFARRIHRQLLPEGTGEIGGAKVEVYYKPQHELGGDYYDLVEIDGEHVGLFLADVTGHGLAAAIDASSVRLSFRMHCNGLYSPAKTLSRMNRDLAESLDYRFVSALYAIIHLPSGRTLLSSAGHPPAVICRARSAALERVESDQVMLGIDPQQDYEDIRLQLFHGDTLLLYTDGILGSLDARISGASDRIVDSLALHVARLLQSGQRPDFERLLQPADHAAPQDDLTLLCFCYDSENISTRGAA